MKVNQFVTLALLTFATFPHAAIAQTSERQEMCTQVLEMGTEAYNSGRKDVTKMAIQTYYQLGCNKLSGFESVNENIESVRAELGVSVPVATKKTTTKKTAGSGKCNAQCQRAIQQVNATSNDAVNNTMSRPNLNRCDGYSSTQDYYRCKDGVPGYPDR